MKYKLFIMDIDETLVTRAGAISKTNADAVTRARDSGVYVTLATGRGYKATSSIIKQLELDTYTINYGGSMIMDSKTDEPIFVTKLEDEYVHEVLDLADELKIHAQIYDGDSVIYRKPHIYAEMYTKALNLPYVIDPTMHLKRWDEVPVVLMITEAERVNELLPMLEKRFYGRVRVSASSPGFIEFHRWGASKGTAASTLAEMLNIERESSAAIGDNTLDYELIEWAGLGVAVGNANERLKRIADVITPPCTENGVAWLIDNYILD